ncbi:MAG: hypothetical protein AB4080_25695 [Trichodesmium sp.]
MVALRSRVSTPSNKSPKTNFSVISPKKLVRGQKPIQKNLSKDRYTSEHNQDLQKTQAEQVAEVISLPQSKPLWVKSLMATQMASSIVTVLLASTSIAIYGWTIYGQSKWTSDYQELQKLRHKEQQISVANELLKNQIAEQASQDSISDTGLVTKDSAKRVFLEPAPPRPAPNAPKPYLESTSSQKYLFNTPIGY